MDGEEGSCSHSEQRRTPTFRRNTREEKRSMRNSRARRLRKMKLKKRMETSLAELHEENADLRRQVKTTQTEMDKAKSQIVTLKYMSRTFWERWRWEAEKRKEEFISSRKFGSRPLSDKLSHDIHEIDPLLLTNPSGRQENHYLGRGSFGIVTLKIYRGIYAAVKQMHVKTVVQDIINEAKMLACLCHPFLPFLLGVCTSTEPFKIVMQFHGLFGSELPYSTTLRRELDQRHLGLSDADWISACAQILEAFDYLHNTVEIIHNDATGTNVLLGSPTTLPLESSSPVCQAGTGRYQILVIDGKQPRQNWVIFFI